MLTFHAVGDWQPGQLDLSWAATSSRRIVPEVERVIEETWARVSSRAGVQLFDGPMCRMESFEPSPQRLRLTLSTTSYKPFVGTNLHNPHLVKTHGRDVLANPVGVSALLETADGFLMLGRRNDSVAYYPSRVHPFAGALEPRDGADAFGAVHRELHEELHLDASDVSDLRCTGLVEDAALLQPELIFNARCRLTRDAVERAMDRVEHDSTWAVAGDAGAIETATGDAALTPVAVASLLLWGRLRIGGDWFADRVARFT
jgi:8-oxo-dGTP pyrophosphatase MutT (NUDIX family)